MATPRLQTELQASRSFCITAGHFKNYLPFLDGVIDSPAVTTLPDVHTLHIKGPFPKYLRYDWRGRFVDNQGHIVTAPLVTFATSSGTSMVKAETGNKSQIFYGSEKIVDFRLKIDEPWT